MILDEAIIHAQEKAVERYTEAMLVHANPDDGKLDDCIKCAREYEQLAEWLRDYKRLLEKEENDNVGFKDDNIFLLSIEEYEKYKDKIPKCNTWRWLRSPGYYTYYAAYVYYSGYVYSYGYSVYYDIYGVCPAIKRKEGCWREGERFIFGNRPFTAIDSKLAIATIPIDFRSFDTEDNDYESSDIRAFLISFYEAGKNQRILNTYAGE